MLTASLKGSHSRSRSIQPLENHLLTRTVTILVKVMASLLESLGLLIFFIGGLYTALSPCLFPLLPLSALKLFQKDVKRKEALTLALALISGIILAFGIFIILVTMFFQQLGLWLLQYYGYLSAFFGVLLILIGLVMIIPRLHVWISRFTTPFNTYLEKETQGALDLFILGLLFSFIAIPCAGPIYLSLTIIIALSRDVIFSILGLTLFSIGLAIPYILLTFASTESRYQLGTKLIRHARKIEIGSAILIIIFGILFILPLFGFPAFLTTNPFSF